MENNIHVPNHQPVNYFHGPFSSIFHSKLLVYRRLCESDLNFSQKFCPMDLLGWFFASSVSSKLMMGTNRDGHKSDGRWPFGSYDHLDTNFDKLILFVPNLLSRFDSQVLSSPNHLMCKWQWKRPYRLRFKGKLWESHLETRDTLLPCLRTGWYSKWHTCPPMTWETSKSSSHSILVAISGYL